MLAASWKSWKRNQKQQLIVLLHSYLFSFVVLAKEKRDSFKLAKNNNLLLYWIYSHSFEFVHTIYFKTQIKFHLVFDPLSHNCYYVLHLSIKLDIIKIISFHIEYEIFYILFDKCLCLNNTHTHIHNITYNVCLPPK